MNRTKKEKQKFKKVFDEVGQCGDVLISNEFEGIVGEKTRNSHWRGVKYKLMEAPSSFSSQSNPLSHP